MKERLIIKNFGPIKEADLTFGRFNVLIGEQATGKSTVAKLLSLLRNREFLFGSKLERYREQDEASLPFEKGTRIEYASEHFLIKYADNDFTIKTAGLYADRLDRIQELYGKLFTGQSLSEKDEFFKLDDWYLEQIGIATYVPAERVFANYLADTGSVLRSDARMRDYFINLNASRKKVGGISMPHLQGVQYLYEDDTDKVVVKGQAISLVNASSGFQASIPIVVLLSSYSTLSFNDYVIVEEPELNLFPTAQYELMKFLVDKTMNYGNTMLIATHSPYILTALNDLILSAQTGKISPEETHEVMDKKYWLDNGQVSAYRMLSDGTCRNILDEETGLIHAEEIDEVSNRINSIYDDLCEIKYAQ